MTTASLFMETRKIRIPHEVIEQLIMDYLEDNGYLTETELAMGVDLGLEVNNQGLVTIDVDLTWTD